MKRVLLIATISSTIYQFNMINIEVLKQQGYKVDAAANFNNISKKNKNKIKKELKQHGVNCINISFNRDILHIFQNFHAIKETITLCKNNNYSFIHCQTPIGGVAGRIAGHLSRTKVIYTAHGFHFYKGAPAINWILYYPIEKILSKWTDILITINKEDFIFAKKMMYAKKIKYVPGVGVNTKKFNSVSLTVKNELRKQYGFPIGKYLLLSVGELNNNKNHKLVIKAIKDMPNIYYYIVGEGDLKIDLKKIISNFSLNNRVKLLGYRYDVNNLYNCCDVFVMPSYREGLPVSMMEAMACGKICIASRIRGNVDLIDEGKGGYLFNVNDISSLKKRIAYVCTKYKNMNYICKYNMNKIVNAYDIKIITRKMKGIYNLF